jgi:hypothetical protein
METFSVLTLVINDVGETENITQKIDYDMTSGNSVNNLTSDVNTKSLIINMTAPESGTINITIPRSIINSRVVDRDDTGMIVCGEGCDCIVDDIFYVIIDGEEIIHTETATTTDRTIIIPFMESSEVMEIIGTSVIEDLYTIGDGIAMATDIRIR